MPVNMERNSQSIFMVNASPRKKPINDLKAIMIKEVPTATFISTFASITRAGIMRKPPPAPIIPVIPPTMRPSIKISE